MEGSSDLQPQKSPFDGVRENLAAARADIDRIREIGETRVVSERGEEAADDWRETFDAARERYDEATAAFQEAVERRIAVAQGLPGIFTRLIDKVRSR